MNRLYKSIMRGGKSHIVRAVVLTLVLGASALTLAVPVPVRAIGIIPPLGTAGNFGVLGSSTVTNTGPTNVTGDLGVSPGTAVTGFPPGIVVGTIHGGDAVAAQAQNDALIAYNNIVGQACDFDLTGQDLGGMTLTSGVYCFSSSAQLTGQLTLDGQNNPDSIFIFKIGSTLTTASNAVVTVINGAQPCRIFLQVSSSATLGTNTRFQGNILALTSITLNTGATTSTGFYALNGAVALDTNEIQAPACTSVATPTSTATVTSTSTATATPTALPSTTNMSTPTATSTLVLAATNTMIPSMTNTPSNAVTVTNTAIPTRTTGPINTPGSDSTSTPANTALSTNTVTLSSPTLTLTLTPLSTQTPSGPSTTPMAPKPSDTPTQTLATQTPITPTQISTPPAVLPGPPLLLPPTGSDFPWLGPFTTLLLSVVMLAMGLGMRRLSGKQAATQGVIQPCRGIKGVPPSPPV